MEDEDMQDENSAKYHSRVVNSVNSFFLCVEEDTHGWFVCILGLDEVQNKDVFVHTEVGIKSHHFVFVIGCVSV